MKKRAPPDGEDEGGDDIDWRAAGAVSAFRARAGEVRDRDRGGLRSDREEDRDEQRDHLYSRNRAGGRTSADKAVALPWSKSSLRYLPCGLGRRETWRMEFPRAEAFDEDYLYFYEELLTPERTAAEVELIWKLLELEPGLELLDLACGHGRIANPLAEARGAGDGPRCDAVLPRARAEGRGRARESRSSTSRRHALASLDGAVRPGALLVHVVRVLQRRREPAGARRPTRCSGRAACSRSS